MTSSEGATHWGRTITQSLEYIRRVYSDYLVYGGLTESDVAGKRILELGPGDNLGVALLFLAGGAEQVVCLDRFFAKKDPEQQIAIYTQLREGLAPAQRRRFDAVATLGAELQFDQKRLHCLYGVGAEDADRVLGRTSFDLIVSRAVLFRVYPIEQCFLALDRILRPGGRMIHKIALIDWIFRQNGYHPLEFLTVPEPVYRLMAGNTGICNRRTIEDYQRIVRELGYQPTCHITRVVGSTASEFPPNITTLEAGIHYDNATVQLIGSIRPRLAPRFRALSDETLMVEDMFLIATKRNED